MTLCTQAQVEALLPSGSIPPATFTSLEELAAPLVNTALGRHAEGGTELTRNFRFVIPRETLLLDRWPVTAVASVTEDGEALTEDGDYVVDLDTGILERRHATAGVAINWPALAPIVVVYTPATVPVARSVCAQAIARAYMATNPAGAGSKPATMAGLRQLTIGRWSATAESSAATTRAALHLTEEEIAQLRAYRDRRP